MWLNVWTQPVWYQVHHYFPKGNSFPCLPQSLYWHLYFQNHLDAEKRTVHYEEQRNLILKLSFSLLTLSLLQVFVLFQVKCNHFNSWVVWLVIIANGLITHWKQREWKETRLNKYIKHKTYFKDSLLDTNRKKCGY